MDLLKKYVISFIAVCACLLVAMLSPIKGQATTQKIGIVFSESSEKYANTTHPGGTYEGQTVSPKVD